LNPSASCASASLERHRRDTTASPAQVAWKKAREASDYPAYAPILQDMFALKREVAATTRPDVCAAGEPYDGALDAFERGMTASRLDSIFAATREGLEPLLKAVLAKKRDAPEVDALHPALAFDHPGWKGSVEKQAELSKRVAADLGFDFTKGRFDVSTFAAVHKSLRLRH
jgi:carboxypeptidase Taq